MFARCTTQLVPVSPSGPLPKKVSEIVFMITSGVEFSPERLQEIFQTGKNIKVALICFHSVQGYVMLIWPHTVNFDFIGYVEQ